MIRALFIAIIAVALGACATAPAPTDPPSRAGKPGNGAPGSDRYEHEVDSAPLRRPDVENQPEPVPRKEPLSAYGNPETYSVWGKTYRVMESAAGYEEVGLASWYGRKFHGYRTSSGETFDMYRFTAAHRTLPLPTYVRVTNLDNGKSLVVRVNDRGPFHSERIIDLSWAAAARLGIEGQGTGRVRVEALTVREEVNPSREGTVPTAVRAAVDSPPPDTAKVSGGGELYLQAGAFRGLDRARDLERALRDKLKLPVSVRQPGSAALYKVWLGPFTSNEARDQARRAIRQAGFTSPIPVN